MDMRHSGPVAAATGQLKALDAFADVPHEKLASMLMRSVVGGLLLLVGLGLVAIAVVPLLKTGDKEKLSLPVFGTGLFLMVLGPTVWSTQLVSKPFQVVLALLRAVVDIVRGNKT